MSAGNSMQDFLRSRRSIRRFQAREVQAEVVERILSTATSAPSAHNRQPWRFVVVSSAGARNNLATSMASAYRRDLATDGLDPARVDQLIRRSTDRIVHTPLLIVLCMDVSEMDQYPDRRRGEAERIMAMQSTANAGMLLLLAAHAEGLGGVWNCSPLFAPAEVMAALGLAPTWEPQAMLLMGFPADTPVAGPRKPLVEISRAI